MFACSETFDEQSCTTRARARGAYLIVACALVLTLRVDHERPAARLRHDDTVLDGEGVHGQAGDVPRADHHGLA